MKDANITTAITSLTYYLTEACNLRCTYCYLEKNPARSSTTVGKATIDFLLKESGREKEVHLRFFGGEPLLELPLLLELVRYGKEQAEQVGKKIRFDMISNGTLLEKQTVDELKHIGVEVINSVDGDRATMQLNRPFYQLGQKQNFDDFDYKLHYALENQVVKVARMTVSPGQTNIVENIRHLLEVGYPEIMIALATNLPWQAEAIEHIYDCLSDFYIESAQAGRILPLQITNQLLFARHEIVQGKYQAPENGFCGAGKEMLGVSPNGQLYPCHRFVQLGGEYRLGDVFNGVNTEKRAPFLNVVTDTLHHEMCLTCPALAYCPGSCMAANLLATGDAFYPESRHCLELRAHVRVVTKIYDVLINNCPAFTAFLRQFQQNKRGKNLKSLFAELMAEA